MVTNRGKTVVPAEIRKRHQIEEGDRLVWYDDGSSIRIVPLPADPIKALRGSVKGRVKSAELSRTNLSGFTYPIE